MLLNTIQFICNANDALFSLTLLFYFCLQQSGGVKLIIKTYYAVIFFCSAKFKHKNKTVYLKFNDTFSQRLVYKCSFKRLLVF